MSICSGKNWRTTGRLAGWQAVRTLNINGLFLDPFPIPGVVYETRVKSQLDFADYPALCSGCAHPPPVRVIRKAKARRNVRPDRAGAHHGIEFLEGRALLSGLTHAEAAAMAAQKAAAAVVAAPHAATVPRMLALGLARPGRGGKRLPNRPPSLHRCWKSRTCSVTATRSRAWS